MTNTQSISPVLSLDSQIFSPPPTDPNVTAAQQRLQSSAYSALRLVRCESLDGAVVLRGRVSSYYLKQLAQEAVRKGGGERVIVNELEVDDFNPSESHFP